MAHRCISFVQQDGMGWSGLVGGMERVGMVCSRYTLYSIKTVIFFSI